MINILNIYISVLFKKLKRNTKFICKLLRFITSYFIIILFYSFNFNVKTIVISMFIPLIVWVITSVINIKVNRHYADDSIPVPQERFTDDAGDGEIRLRKDRLQELIMYIYILEEWFCNNGYMK